MSSPQASPSGVVVAPLLRLVRQMRRAGVTVSSSELIDATTALQHVDILNRQQFRTALATTMVKQVEDLRTFNLLFDLHFAPRTASIVDQEPSDSLGSPQHGSVRSIETSLDRITLNREGDSSADLVELIMDALQRGDTEALRALADMAVREYGGIGSQPDATERYFLYRVLRALELSKLMADVLAAVRESGEKFDERQMRNELAERIDAFKQLLASAVRGQLAQERGAEETSRMLELLGTDEIDFLGASPRQLAQMREQIRPLARALATKMARRRRRRDRGRLDVRRTVRRSLSSGGVLLDPAFRRPKVSRPDLYLLCDVSGSVAEFASFTLTLLQAMTAEFSRMRSFAFVDGIDEVTDHLKDVASFLEVRHVLYRADVVRDDGHSDFGAVFEQFLEAHGHALDSRSTVIITGDARSNHRSPGLSALRAIHVRARKVYLLNPEPEADWDTADSIVSTYSEALDGVFEVRNLRQLGEAVYRIT